MAQAGRHSSSISIDRPHYYAIRYSVLRNMSDPVMLVLASLAGGPKHGYAMMQDIEQFSGFRLGPGTLYGAITRLEERGWIAPVKSDDRRRPYMLTALGRKHFEEELAVFERFVKAGVRRLKHA